MKKLFPVLGLSVLLASCGSAVNTTTITAAESAISITTEETTAIEETTATEETTTETETTTTEEGNPVVCISLSSGKSITCELYPEIAPISVKNFLSLADSGFYDNTIFHRTIQNFMIQGGGYYLDGYTICPKSASTIKGEFSANGVENSLSHTQGVLSMARASAYDSASSQFFICVADCTYLDGNYAAFGKTVDEESLNVAIEMSKAETCVVSSAFQNFPVSPISITGISRVTTE